MKYRHKRLVLTILVMSGISILTTSACDSNTSAQTQSQDLSNQIGNAASSAVPYPLSQMEAGGWLEMRMLNEHLLRQNDKNATRWVIWTTTGGQVMAQWPIQGMVFDPNSQMSHTQDVVTSSSGSNAAVASPGDNGTYGPEAMCYSFFTTSGAEIQLSCSAIVIESDAPISVTTPPIINYNINSSPSVHEGNDVKVGNH